MPDNTGNPHCCNNTMFWTPRRRGTFCNEISDPLAKKVVNSCSAQKSDERQCFSVDEMKIRKER